MDDFKKYFNGEELYGNNFTPQQIAEWYSDEKEGYADLGAKDRSTYKYGYHGWNMYHVYKYLPLNEIKKVLGFGSAYGDELLPIISTIDTITIVDPSDSFANNNLQGKPIEYIKPTSDGVLPLSTSTFDLITCFGVLHHVPNVSFVISELSRILKPGGYLVIREPIVSMGDWRKPRAGLTKRERGIPLNILKDIAKKVELNVVRQSLCAFPITRRVFGWLKNEVYNNNIAVRFDSILSKAFSWNINYHPKNTLQYFRPTSTYLILQKDQ